MTRTTLVRVVIIIGFVAFMILTLCLLQHATS